jgi:two-component system response regulator CpxR
MDRILIVDDDFELCSLVSEYLAPEGFRVESVHDGETGLQRALSGNYLMVVLDVMLPGMSGFDVLRRVRATSRVPVLLLTARGEDVDRIVGLEIGADDYLPKPFNPRELVARIRAVLRRTSADPKGVGTPRAPEILRIGDIELDPATRTVRHGGEPVVRGDRFRVQRQGLLLQRFGARYIVVDQICPFRRHHLDNRST